MVFWSFITLGLGTSRRTLQGRGMPSLRRGLRLRGRRLLARLVRSRLMLGLRGRGVVVIVMMRAVLATAAVVEVRLVVAMTATVMMTEFGEGMGLSPPPSDSFSRMYVCL